MDLLSLDTAPEGLTQWAFNGEPRSTVGSSAFAVRYSPALGIHCVARRALRPGDPVLLEPPLVSTRTATVDGLPSAEPEWMLVHALLTAGKRRRWALQYASLAGAAPSGLEAVCSWLSEAHGVAADEPALLWQAVRGNAFGLETPLLGVESGGKPGEWPPLGSATARDPGRLWMARRRVWAALLTPEGSCYRSRRGDSTLRCRAKAAGLALLTAQVRCRALPVGAHLQPRVRAQLPLGAAGRQHGPLRHARHPGRRRADALVPTAGGARSACGPPPAAPALRVQLRALQGRSGGGGGERNGRRCAGQHRRRGRRPAARGGSRGAPCFPRELRCR